MSEPTRRVLSAEDCARFRKDRTREEACCDDVDPDMILRLLDTIDDLRELVANPDRDLFEAAAREIAAFEETPFQPTGEIPPEIAPWEHRRTDISTVSLGHAGVAEPRKDRTLRIDIDVADDGSVIEATRTVDPWEGLP